MSNPEGTKQIWIEKGYEHFALYGPAKFSVNKISNEMGLSRASFYHHFGDTEVFMEELLDMHWQIGLQYSSAGRLKCKNLFPDLYELVAQYPVPLLFSRQLFLNRDNPAFSYLFMKMYNTHSRDFILALFAKQFDLHQTTEDLQRLWFTVGESWYSRLDPADLSAQKMEQLAREIMSSVLKFVSSDLFSAIHG